MSHREWDRCKRWYMNLYLLTMEPWLDRVQGSKGGEIGVPASAAAPRVGIPGRITVRQNRNAEPSRSVLGYSIRLSGSSSNSKTKNS
jgi:hypothetical protein